MDYIHIEKLTVRGKHGVTDHERKVEQEFEISLRLGIDETTPAAKSEQLTDTVDYQPIQEEIIAIIEGNSFYLIETLADTIATKVFEDARIHSLELTIKKPEVWQNGVPGLTIMRTRP